MFFNISFGFYATMQPDDASRKGYFAKPTTMFAFFRTPIAKISRNLPNFALQRKKHGENVKINVCFCLSENMLHSAAIDLDESEYIYIAASGDREQLTPCNDAAMYNDWD